MNIKGVGIGRGVAVGRLFAWPLRCLNRRTHRVPKASTPKLKSIRVERSLALVNADLNRRAEEAANGDERRPKAARFFRPSPCSPPTRPLRSPSGI